MFLLSLRNPVDPQILLLPFSRHPVDAQIMFSVSSLFVIRVLAVLWLFYVVILHGSLKQYLGQGQKLNLCTASHCPPQVCIAALN